MLLITLENDMKIDCNILNSKGMKVTLASDA